MALCKCPCAAKRGSVAVQLKEALDAPGRLHEVAEQTPAERLPVSQKVPRPLPSASKHAASDTSAGSLAVGRAEGEPSPEARIQSFAEVASGRRKKTCELIAPQGNSSVSRKNSGKVGRTTSS